MYPLGHPVTQETLKKPLDSLNKLYLIKHSFTIELVNNMLLAEGICLEDTIYVSGIALDMKKHKLNNLILCSTINVGDLYHLLLMLTAKAGPYEDNVQRVLNSKKITSVRVNIESPPRLFNFDHTGVSGDPGQFSLKKRVRSIISKRSGVIAGYYLNKVRNDDDILKYLNVDFRYKYIADQFKEAFYDMGMEQGKKLLENTVYSTNWLDDDINPDTLIGMKKLFTDFLGKFKDDDVLAELYELFKKVGAPDAILEQIFSKSTVLKLRTFQESEEIINTLRFSDPSMIDPPHLKKTLFKLAATGQRNYFGDLIDQLLKSLSSPTNELRQKGLSLAITAGEVLSRGGFPVEFNYICRESVRLALTPSETIEPIELAAQLTWQSLKDGMWQELKFLTSTLKGIRDDKTQPEAKRSLAGSKITEIAESSLLGETFSKILEKGWSDESSGFFDTFSNLGARSIIRMLADRLIHPDINMRSRVIKLLVGMKKDTADVLTQILSEMVEQYKGGQLKDEQWYLYRNILRVLKEVRADEAVTYLEIMTNWEDSRIKIEIIKTLEGMPAENAGKLLEKLAGDPDSEIRKAAVVAMGLTGHPDMVPRLVNIFFDHPDSRINAIAAIGRIGGPQARDRLIEIFEDNSFFAEFDISKKDTEQIRVAILKALSRINDHVVMEKLEEYSQTDFDKSLFKKDLLSNTAKIILDSKTKKLSI